MVRDRMSELCASRRNDSYFSRSLLPDITIQIPHKKKIKDILEKVDEIRGMINILKDNVNIVKDLHNNILSHTNSDIKIELQSRTFIISQTSFRIQTGLKDFGGKIPRVDEPTLDSAEDGPAHARIRFLQYITMLQIFSDIMHGYNESLMRYHEKCASLLHQHRILLCKETDNQVFQSDDEIDQKMSLFVDNILEESETAKFQLSEIQSRHNEMLKLEKSLVEIRDLFFEIAFIVEKQGEQLNCVEYFAGKASNDVEEGRYDLIKAEIKRDRSRKRKTKLFIILGVILTILILLAIVL